MSPDLVRRCWSGWAGPKERCSGESPHVQKNFIMDKCVIYKCVNLKHMFYLLCLVKGLGRSEQGCTDHVKVKLKNDSYGLGVNTSYEVSYGINILISFYCFRNAKIVRFFLNVVDRFFFFLLLQDNWIAHQDDFNELLAQLNNHHGQNKSIGTPSIHPFSIPVYPHVGRRGLLESLPALT